MADRIGSRTLRELTRVIFTRLWLVLAIIALVTGGTLVACLKATKHFRSSVTFLVKEPRQQNPTAQGVSMDRSLEVFIKTQHELIMSETVLTRTMLLFGAICAGDYPDQPEYSAYAQHGPLAAAWQEAREKWTREDTPENLKAFGASLKAVDDAVARLRQAGAIDGTFMEGVRRLAKRVKVETPGGEKVALAEVFTITVTQPGKPQQAQLMADLLAKNYRDRYRQVQAATSRNATEFVRQRLAQFRQERLVPAEDALRKFVETELESPSDLGILEQLGKSGTEAGWQIVMRRFREDIINLDGELASSRQLRQQVLEQLPKGLWGDQPRQDAAGELTVPDVAQLDEKRLPDDDPILTDIVTIIPDVTLRTNVVINQLKTKEVELLTKLNRLIVEYQPDYRGVRDMRKEISGTRRQILKELIGEARALDIPIATLSARQAELQRKVEEVQKRVDRISTLLVQYQELQHEVSSAREEHRRMSGDLVSARTFQDQESEAVTINIIDEATLPDERLPAFPKTLPYTLIAALVGFLLAVAYAFFGDYFDHTLNSIDQAERYLGVPVVGSIGRCHGGLLT